MIEMVAAAWVLSISWKLTQNITVNPFWKHGIFLCQQLEKAKILISHLTSEAVQCLSCPYLSVCIFCSFFSFLFLPPDEINLSQRCCLLGVFSTKWFLYSSVRCKVNGNSSRNALLSFYLGVWLCTDLSPSAAGWGVTSAMSKEQSLHTPEPEKSCSLVPVLILHLLLLSGEKLSSSLGFPVERTAVLLLIVYVISPENQFPSLMY